MIATLFKALLVVRLYVFAISAMVYVHGSARPANRELAASMVRAVMNAEPLYQVDTLRERTLSDLIATAKGESSLRSDAIGDGGKSVGPFQILYGHHLTNQGADEALRQMRVSLEMCGNFATAYLSGGCTNARAQRLAAQREREALEIYTKVER